MTRTTSALLTCSFAAFAIAHASAQVTMTPLAGFGTNGWLAPGANPYVSTGNTERGLAYNPMTGNLVLVARQNVGGVANNVRVLSGTTGADLGGLVNTGLTGGGTFAVNMVGVDDVGAIYVGNLTTTATAPFVVYKWDSEAWGATNPPSIAFTALTGLPRVGDAFAVNGGLFFPTQFAAAGSNSTVSGVNGYFALGSVDATNTYTNYTNLIAVSSANNEYRLGLTFVDQTTLIGTQGTTGLYTAITPPTATVAAQVPLGGAARRAMDYAVIGNTPVLAVIDTNSSQVTVFNMLNPANPVQIATGNATSGTLTANANGTSSVAWGAINGTSAVLYAMSSNQGIQAFQVTLNPAASVSAFGTGCDNLVHTQVSSVPSIGNANFQLAVSGVSPVSPIAFIAFGATAVNPGLDLTFLGMPGCFGYNGLEIGLFATGPVGGGVAVFPLGIPNDATLAGTTIASQAIALSLLTPAGLASSNGLLLGLGF